MFRNKAKNLVNEASAAVSGATRGSDHSEAGDQSASPPLGGADADTISGSISVGSSGVSFWSGSGNDTFDFGTGGITGSAGGTAYFWNEDGTDSIVLSNITSATGAGVFFGVTSGSSMNISFAAAATSVAAYVWVQRVSHHPCRCLLEPGKESNHEPFNACVLGVLLTHPGHRWPAAEGFQRPAPRRFHWRAPPPILDEF